MIGLQQAEGNLPLYIAHIAVDKSIQPGKIWVGGQGQAAYAGKETEPSKVRLHRRTSGPDRESSD